MISLARSSSKYYSNDLPGLAFVMFIIFYRSISFGADTPESKVKPRNPVLDLGNDFVDLARRPAFIVLIGGLASMPSVIEDDEPMFLHRLLQSDDDGSEIFRYGDAMGNALIPLGAATVSYCVGRVAKRDGLTSFGSDLLRAQALTGLFTSSMKLATNRTRPDGTPYSFPSGHTAVTFATAGVIYNHFGKTWGALAGLAATYVGISRIQVNKHYVSDVFGGAVLGSYISLYVCKNSGFMSNVSISPSVGHNNVRLSLTCKI